MTVPRLFVDAAALLPGPKSAAGPARRTISATCCAAPRAIRSFCSTAGRRVAGAHHRAAPRPRRLRRRTAGTAAAARTGSVAGLCAAETRRHGPGGAEGDRTRCRRAAAGAHRAQQHDAGEPRPPARHRHRSCGAVRAPDRSRHTAAAAAGSPAGSTGRRPAACSSPPNVPTRRILRPATGPAGLLVGPEGGFTPAELDALRRCAFVALASLGPRILRAETACLAGLTLLQAPGCG